MSTTTLTCPQCLSALRSSRALTTPRSVRCPQCGNQFQAAPEAITTAPAPAPAPTPVQETLVPIVPPSSRSLLLPITAVCLTLLLMTGGIVVALLLGRDRTPPVAEADPEKQRLLEELKDREKQLAGKIKEIADDKKKQQFARLLADGEAALAKRDFSLAEKLFNDALLLYPDDSQARAGLVKAGTEAAVTSRTGEDQQKRQVEYNRLMTLGKEKMDAKEYSLAVRAYEDALQVMVADPMATTALNTAREALASDQSEKKKLDQYKVHMEAGRVAMLNERYPDAVREYLAAGQLLAGDPAAARGLRDAEKRLNDLNDAEKKKDVYAKTLERGRNALQERRFELAIDCFDACLRLFPNDREAGNQLRDAKKARLDAQADYRRFMTQGDGALRANRYEEAIRSFQEAVRVMPTDEAANRGLRQAQKAFEDAGAAQAAYVRYMAQGTAALNNNRFADAVVAFTEAVRIAPLDRDANAGLREAARFVKKEVERKKDYDKLMVAAKNFMLQQRWPEAVKVLEDALAISPDDLLANQTLKKARYGKAMADGRTAAQARRWGDAIRAYEDALTLAPGDFTARTALAQAKAMQK